jgi:tRNA(adenine34) deaminase
MNPFTDEYFMKQALVEARQAALEGEVPVGAVVVCNNKIIARAHNQTERLNDPTAHEPCIMCAGAIGWAQVSTIVYGASDEKRGFSLFAPKAMHPKAVVKKGILETECAAEMISFFKKKR